MWHVSKIELALLFVVSLELSSIVVLALLRCLGLEMSLLFGLKPQRKNKQVKTDADLSVNHVKTLFVQSIFHPPHFLDISFCCIDVQIRLLCVLCRALCFSPLPLKALFTLRGQRVQFIKVSLHQI